LSIHVAIEHRTLYRFDRLVRLAPHVVRLRPAPHCRTPILAYSLQVTPAGHFVNWQQDPFGNHLARFVFPEPARQLTVTVDLIADLTVINPFDFFVDEEAAHYPFRYDEGLALDLAPYLLVEDAGPLITEWTAGAAAEGQGIIDFLVALNRRLAGDVAYTIRMDPGVQTPEDTLAKGIGSCRDSAWLLVQILRRLGIAARFASGYLVQLTPDIPPADGPAGPSADFTDLHAWAEAYIPGAGWIGLDPTSGLLTGEGHIPLACTPSPSSAAPIAGSVDACETTFEFTNIVRRIEGDVRVTRPYSAEQWSRIDALGRTVDADLEAGDTRLTMGGEPTFVSMDDMEGAEWNTAADGPTKQKLATALARRLAAVFAPGGLIQHGQGKWYPGEPLPRWQIGVLWRADGRPCWSDPELLADPSVPGRATLAEVASLAAAIAVRLDIPDEYRVPAYEDTVHRLWAEARLPAGSPPDLTEPDPLDPTLSVPDARARIIADLDAGRGEPRGYAIPLHRAAGQPFWSTGRWVLRRGALFLVPGDSPMGLRLPLDSLTWTPPPADPDRSPFEPRPALPVASPPAPVLPDDARPPITSLCVELRDGHAHVFLPPLTELEHALELIGVVEAAAEELGLAVVVEGYPPPSDPRLRHLVLTPDPGVIEVNIHPAASWSDLVERTTTLVAEARAVRLGTEKFALDGTHTGTGGGNHLTLGGPTAADSPLLRRPDLLRSLITYWQHHPSLSYLFSGRFVGPTSQSPRVDEGRAENLYELEIAFSEMERLSEGRETVPPWLVDRLLRHLLVDVTGNTHRAEFCIDKLFSPDGERGRLGLVELRGFEMPPHPQMTLVQALLVRALVARFWSRPYTGEPVRWGSELHDRFLLPFWVAADITDVVEDLGRHGYHFDRSWLAPFLEFRFPPLGVLNLDALSLELRMAIEPWNVLGEEVTATTTARYVDSSVERIQVRVDGMTESRYLVACNGCTVPLQPTGTAGTFVAGVRYRAWQPPSALHPTIEVHAPLVFDVIDRWSGRAVGGCTYHITHPGGRAYDRFPVNANEAEARRTSRFTPTGHTAGRIEPITDPGGGGEYPRTLDLRRVRRR